MDTTRVAELAAPLARAASLEVYDVEQLGNTIRVSLSGLGGTGASVTDLENVSRSLSLALDEAQLSGAAYVLEVSTPGVERKLRTHDHFIAATGQVVSVTSRSPEGRQRLRGQLISCDANSITVSDTELGPVTVDLSVIDKAKTIFEWGPAPKPGKGPAQQSSPQTRNKAGS